VSSGTPPSEPQPEPPPTEAATPPPGPLDSTYAAPQPPPQGEAHTAPPPPPPGSGFAAGMPPPPPPQAPPVQVQADVMAPHLSPDGRWWWNGSHWVPSPVQPPPVMSKHNRQTAGLLGILLGDFGVHKFYLGQTGMGILYLCFFWTFIPGIVGIVEGIQYLTMSDEAFAAKFG
jgi:TM2 domain-containing membrane protein YozV